jgi:hypothetical protein
VCDAFVEIARADRPMMKAVRAARLECLAKHRRLVVMLLDQFDHHLAAEG